MSEDGDAGGPPRPLVERPERQSVFLGTTLERFGSSQATRHRVRDLSPYGMRIDQADGLQKGATVLVAVGVLTAVGATVRWVKDGQAGLQFATRIDPDQARSKAAIAPKKTDGRGTARAGTPTAGWLPDLADPYHGKGR